jgi:WD40 repeat protein
MWRPGDEPIPGYCLERFLGRGNFGEVWLARAPGGTSAALKFIDLSGKNGIREFRGITRVKGIKHANLMPITAIWMLDENGQLVDDRQLQQYDPQRDTGDGATDTLAVTSQSRPRAGCLVVAMLAGDKNLGERLEECQEEGLPGIPVDELLVYMEEAAKGLDRLNLLEHDLGDGPMRIQHCDIKPANMMLVGGAVLICDFGLAQVLGDSHVNQSITGSPAFMAPECFEKGGTSANRDQYALAIAYHELRTGALPFDDESYGAVRDAHAKGTLNLSRLPEAEQQVIRRATSPRPSDRYASSSEMVQALKETVHPAAARGTAAPPARRWGVVAALACLVGIVAAFAAWPWLFSSPTVDLSVLPEDARVQIDGQAQTTENGRLTLPLTDRQTVRIRVFHDSGWYDEIDQEFTKDQLARRDYQLQLQRLAELRFQPADVQVRVDDVGQTVRDGKLRLLLDDEAPVRITVSDPDGMYQTLDRLYSARELRDQGLRIELQPSAQHHVQAAYQLYEEGMLDQARERFRAAVELGHATSVRTVDLAQQTTGAIRLAHLGPRGRWLVTASKNTEALFLWDLSAPDPAASALALQAHDDLVNCADFSSDERWLVTGGRDKQVRLWDLQAATAPPSRVLGQHASDVVSVAVDPVAQWIASADFAGTIHVWPIGAQSVSEPTATLAATSEIRQVLVDPSGQWLVALSELGELFGWDMRSDDPSTTLRTFATPEHEIKCLAFAPDGHRLYAGASGGTILEWDLTGGHVSPSRTRGGHSDDVEVLVVSQDGTLLLTGGADREVRVWQLSAGQEKEPRTLLGHDHLISALALSANGRWLVSGSWDKTIRLWDLQSSNPAATCMELDELDERVRDVATDANRRWLVACGVDGQAMLWDFRDLLLNATAGK